MRLLRSCLFVACAASGITALLVGGIAWATQSPVSGGVVHACYNASNGNVVLNVNASCPGAESTPITWNVAGQQGPQGAAGPAGPQGAAAPAPQVREVELGPLTLPVDPNELITKEVDVHGCAQIAVSTNSLNVSHVNVYASHAGGELGYIDAASANGSGSSAGLFFRFTNYTATATVVFGIVSSSTAMTVPMDAWVECQTSG
jgi:hypothetical protein